MSPSRILLPEEPTSDIDRSLPWRLLSGTGLALAVVAVGDLALGVFPLRLGDVQWEFGTVSRLFDSLPLMTMAATMFMVGSALLGRRLSVRLAGGVAIVVGLFLAGALLIYGLTLPLALKAVTDPLALGGLKRAMVKTVLQGVVYPLAFIGMGLAALRRTAQPARR